jgi:D-alanyl-D-alanine-carboxypeptidase/D-alanyl-D-alanine-endopeptidase
MRTTSLISLLLVGFGCTANSGYCDDAATWQAKALTGIQQLQNEELWVGGTVGVYYQGDRSIQTSGETSPGSGIAPSSQSLFELGSVSKSFTGVLLAELAGEIPGMTIDDAIGKYLPELASTFSAKMTLRQLATHTSGLPRMPCSDPSIGYCFHPKDPSNPYVDYTATQLLAYLKSFSLANPGPYPENYSNTGTAVLGYVLTRITGKSFDEMLAERITGPLGMNHTLVNRAEFQPIPDFLKSFDIDRTEISHWEWDVFAPAGGILSDADDMMKYLAANISPPNTALGIALTSSHESGLGWDSPAGSAVVFKNGQTSGFHTIIFFNPKQGTGVFVLGNIGSSYTDYVGTMVFNLPMPNLMGKALPTAEMLSYIGAYKSTKDGTFLKITQPGKFLFATLSGNKFRLDAVTDTDFNGFDDLDSDGYEKVSFQKSADGAVSGLVFSMNDGTGKYQDVTYLKQ